MVEKIIVKVHLRDGEYGRAGRFEFPDRATLNRFLESFIPSETGRFRLHSFNNVVVSREFPEEFKTFLISKGGELGLEVAFEET